MSDRMDDVLASIDAALDGADDDWTVSGDAMRWAPPEKPRELPKRPVDRYTMRRASYHNPPSMAVPMRNGAQTADAWAAGFELAYRETFAGQVEALNDRVRESTEALADRLGTTVEALQSLGRALAAGGPVVRAVEGTTVTFSTLNEAQVFWCPEVADPAGPTAAELDAGIPLARITEGQASYEAPQDPCRVYWGSHGCHLDRGHQGPHRCDPDCPPIDGYEPYGEDAGPDQFRRRALEHQQNRGSGPPQRRQRLPRDHRR